MNRELKDESYGVELLNSIGRAYQAKASQHQVSSFPGSAEEVR
jgi:hypothetical protein